MRTIQSMYTPMGQGHLGGGTIVHKETEILPGIRYALVQTVTFGYKFNPAGYKRTVNYSVCRFELEIYDGKEFWNETSYYSCKNKAEANKVFKVSTVIK